jgi:uncharacterized protein
MLAPLISNNIDSISLICKEHQVKELYVFGSATTEKFSSQSDIDFSYVMGDVPLEESADNFFDMLWKFEALFSRKVDLVNEAVIENKYFIRELNEKKQLVYHG